MSDYQAVDLSKIDPNFIARVLREAPMLAVDTETSGLDVRTCHSVGYVYTWGEKPDETVYLPFNHTGGGNLTWDPVEMTRKELAPRRDVRLIFHHGAFDQRFFWKDGITFNAPMEDTQVNMALIDERQPTSLDATCKFMRVQEKKGDPLYKYLASKFGGHDDKKQMGNFHKLAGDDFIGWDYAAGDGTSTWQVRQAQQLELDAQDLRFIWKIECGMLRVLHRMWVRGVRIDQERLVQVRRAVARNLEIARSKLPVDFNERAPSQLVKLFTDAGITDWPLTEKDNPSFAEHWLMTTELGRNIVAARKLRNLENSFLAPLVDRHIINGRVHCQYNQVMGDEFGTVTGRLSSNNPNMQQVPKRNELLGAMFRSIFIPDDGMIFASADYAQIEPRLAAHYGQIKVWLDGYRSDPPVDAHDAVAKAAGIKRQSGKTLNQLLLTGGGMGKAVAAIPLPRAEAERVVESYFAAMPEVRKLQKLAINVMRSRGYIRSLMNRRSRMESHSLAYKAMNRILQCSNADVVKKSMVDCDAYLEAQGDRTNMLMSIHDDLGFQFHPDLRPEYEECLRMMQDYGPGKSIELSLDLLVDAAEGKNWAEASYGVEQVTKSFKEMGEEYQ